MNLNQIRIIEASQISKKSYKMTFSSIVTKVTLSALKPIKNMNSGHL